MYERATILILTDRTLLSTHCISNRILSYLIRYENPESKRDKLRLERERRSDKDENRNAAWRSQAHQIIVKVYREHKKIRL